MAGWIETLNLDGTLRHRWDDAGGYGLNAPLEPPDEEWNRTELDWPWVDGVFETHSSLGRQRLLTTIEVRGATWPQCEHRARALVEDVGSTHDLLLKVALNGVEWLYRAYRPDVNAPLGTAPTTGIRTVRLTWPVLPHPTITGTEA